MKYITGALLLLLIIIGVGIVLLVGLISIVILCGTAAVLQDHDHIPRALRLSTWRKRTITERINE